MLMQRGVHTYSDLQQQSHQKSFIFNESWQFPVTWVSVTAEEGFGSVDKSLTMCKWAATQWRQTVYDFTVDWLQN